LVPGPYRALLVAVAGAFLPLVALALARPIIQRRLRSNYPIVALVLLLAAASGSPCPAGCQDERGNGVACSPGCGWWRR
jgi:uncharacterized protein involved in response to NO